jgi:hypothetical protein
MDNISIILFVILGVFFIVFLYSSYASFQCCPKCYYPLGSAKCHWDDKTNELIFVCARCSYTKREKR